MAKGRHDEHRAHDDGDPSARDQDHEREAEGPTVGEMGQPAEPPRHPVLEHIFGAPIENVPEGQPLRGRRRPLPAPVADTPEGEPLVPLVPRRR